MALERSAFYQPFSNMPHLFQAAMARRGLWVRQMPLMPFASCWMYIHMSAFRTQTSETLFKSINANTTSERHTIWLAKIRTVVRQRADTESRSMLSTESLLYTSLETMLMGLTNVELCHSNHNHSAR